jgi:hypothetical protein
MISYYANEDIFAFQYGGNILTPSYHSEELDAHFNNFKFLCEAMIVLEENL